MNFIITGSKGLIGSRLKERLEQGGHKCILEIDPRIGSNTQNLNSMWLNEEKQKIDVFIHCGAFCKIKDAIENPILAHDNNATGTFEVFEFCRKHHIPRILYFSSSRVIFPERTIYTATKLYGEELCKAYQRCYGIDYIIVRPSTVYSDEHYDLTGRLLSEWIENAIKNKPLIFHGDENKTLDFTYIDDFVDGIFILLQNWDKAKNDDYDISGECSTKLMNVARIIQKILNKRIDIDMIEPELEQPQQVQVDISKMKALGYKPKIGIEEGIRRMIKSYLEMEEVNGE
jgi:UDP-glucose 4-epimerase